MDASTAESLLSIAEEARSRLRGPASGSARAQIDERYLELLAALDWFAEAGRVDDAHRLATALVPFWMATKRIEDGDAWFRRALELPGGTALRRARATYDHGYLVFWAGKYDLADQRFTEARRLAAAANDPTVAALALAGSARVALNTDVDAAVRLLREALAVTDGTADRDGRSSAMHVLGVALQMSGAPQPCSGPPGHCWNAQAGNGHPTSGSSSKPPARFWRQHLRPRSSNEREGWVRR